MPVPSTTYDIGIPLAPSADIDGFSYIDDEINHSSGWWAAVDTEDGTKGRCYLNSDETELATDSIDFASTGTGQRRIYIGTVLAASSDASRAVRSYPPNTANTSYLATDTYGQYNAYSSIVESYYPNGGATDRTATQNNLSSTGGVAEGNTSTPYGAGTRYDGSQFFSGTATITSEPLVFMTLMEDETGGPSVAMGLADSSTTDQQFQFGRWLDSTIFTQSFFRSALRVNSSTTLSQDTFGHGAGRHVSNNNRRAYLNGSGEDIDTGTLSPSGIDSFSIGGTADTTPLYFTGTLVHSFLFNSDISIDYIAEESDQLLDNATFWGTWTNVPVGETVNLSPLFTGEGSIAAPVTIFELISLSPIFDGTGDLQVSLAIEEILQLIPTFDDDGSILVTITISEDVFLSPVFDGQGEMDISLTIIDNNPVFLSPIFNGEGAFISGLTILGDELSIDTIDTSGKIKRKLKTEGLIVRRFNTSGVLTLELKTTGLLGNNIQTTGDLS